MPNPPPMDVQERVTLRSQVTLGGSWCQTCQQQIGGPVSGLRHQETEPSHVVWLRTNLTRWVLY